MQCYGKYDRFNYFTTDYIWVPFVSFLAIALRTMSGGWKIVKTMGTRITKVTPLEGVSAEQLVRSPYSLPITLVFRYLRHIPLPGSIIGIGFTKRVSAVRWGVTMQSTLGLDTYHSGKCSYCRTDAIFWCNRFLENNIF